MKCFEFNLEKIIKVVLSGKQTFTDTDRHITRVNPEHIMYFQISGHLHLENAGNDILLEPGDIYLFKKGDFQKPLESSACEYYYVHFTTDPVAEFDVTEKEYRTLISNKKNPFSVFIKQKNHINNPNALLNIIDVLKSNKIWSVSSIADVLKCFSAFSSVLFTLENSDFHTNENYKSYTIVKKISDYLELHYSENFNSNLLEEIFHLNYDYANRLFKKFKGLSIMAYRNKLRIIKAKEKITVSGKPLSEIAAEVGFSDNCYFSRCFKKLEKISPKEFRERLNRNEIL